MGGDDRKREVGSGDWDNPKKNAGYGLVVLYLVLILLWRL